MQLRTSRTGFALALLVSAFVSFAIFRWQVVTLDRADDLWTGLSVEACAWGALWCVYAALERSSNRFVRLSGALLFYGLFYFSACLIFAYTFFFDSAVERRMSLLDIDLAGMAYFFTNVLPPKGWAVLLAIVVATHGGALLLRNTRLAPPLGAAVTALVLLAGLASYGAHNATRVATPLYDIVHDVWELEVTPRVTFAADTKPYRPPHTLDKSKNAPYPLDTPFKKVLVFVMETMTSQKFDDEGRKLDKSTFFVRERSHFHEFGRYFPNNQDSRTGMLDLTGSRLIPYEAYTDADLAKYEHVRKAPSLVTRFHSLGYRTAFAVSQKDLEPVITELPWDQIVRLSDPEIDEARKTKLCFTPYEFEHSCEDLVLLPKVLDFVEKNERVFLFQEFIWGHAWEYNGASGRTNADYYSAYLDRVVEGLKQRGVLDDTLIVVTSDHGFRDKGLQDQLSVYRIPLLLYATRFSAQHDERLLSHLDFKDILFDALAPGSAHISDNDLVMIVGPTETGFIAALTKNNDFLLVKRRGDAHLLVSHKNVGASLHDQNRPVEPEIAPSLLKMFYDYQREFATLEAAPALENARL
jgi:hypothetical protein